MKIFKEPLIKSLRRHAGERLHGCRRYDSRDGIGRVESGTETEGDAWSQSRNQHPLTTCFNWILVAHTHPCATRHFSHPVGRLARMTIERTIRLKQRFLKLASLPLLPLTLLLSGCENNIEVQADIYDSTPVVYRSIDISVEAAGIIEPETTIEVKSKASGEILVLNAETGDHVAEGTLLVQVDKRTPRNHSAQAEADLQAARARRQIAITQLNRTKSLIERGIVTEIEYETAQLELANAEALVISREVGLENAKIALDDTDVRAPISGVIINRNVERGQVISSPTQDVGGGTILLKMADLSTVQVRTSVDETDIGKIHPGMPVTVNVAAFPNQPFQGEVLKIEPLATVEQNITMFPVLIRLENRNGMLRPGMNAEVKINIAHAGNVLAVPTMALRTNRDLSTTAAMLGLEDTELRQLISASQRDIQAGSRSTTLPAQLSATASDGDRDVSVAEGITPEQAKVMMERRQNNQGLTTTERDIMQKVSQARGGGGGRAQSDIDYQYGGDYWVLQQVNGKLVPTAVRTGITDLDYSEIIAGLSEGDRVLILPSSGLIERQERMQESLNRRMRLPGM